MATLAAALSTGDTIQLIALLLGMIIGVSFLFQRIGEARLKHLVALRDEVDASVEAIDDAVAGLEASQDLTSVTIEGVVRSLDLVAVYLESTGGIIEELLEMAPDSKYPAFVDVHADLIKTLRRANDELRVLSDDPERRLSAVKNLAFGQANYRALEIVKTASTLYPDDSHLADFERELRNHLRES